MGHIIAVINQKGGVGKTTTVINLAAYLRKLSKSVLIVDIDPQGNATSGMGVDKKVLASSTREIMLDGQPLNSALLEVEAGIHLIPTGQGLAGFELEIIDSQDREFKLRSSLQHGNYDYTLIDCPPSLSLLTVNALAAADSIIIPVQAEYYALEGLSQLIEVIELIKNGINPELDILGVLLTMFDSRNMLSKQVQAEVRNFFGAKVFDTVIPRNVRLAEAPSHGKSIAGYDKWSKGAKAYRALAKEVADRTISA